MVKFLYMMTEKDFFYKKKIRRTNSQDNLVCTLNRNFAIWVELYLCQDKVDPLACSIFEDNLSQLIHIFHSCHQFHAPLNSIFSIVDTGYDHTAVHPC